MRGCVLALSTLACGDVDITITAPPNHHVEVRRTPNGYQIDIEPGTGVNGGAIHLWTKGGWVPAHLSASDGDTLGGPMVPPPLEPPILPEPPAVPEAK